MKSAASRALRVAAAGKNRSQQLSASSGALRGGTRCYQHRRSKGPTSVRVPRTASLVTEPMRVTQDETFVHRAVLGQGPTSLDTRNGRVVLTGNDLSSLSAPPHADKFPEPLATILLSDGAHGRPRSAAELEQIREDIINYFHKTFTLTEKLHEIFSKASALYEKHERLRHPPIFYLGHTASFYVNKLHLGKYISERIDPVLEMQMAVGVDEMTWDDWDSNSYVWPSGAEARADEERAVAFLQKVLDLRWEVRQMVDAMMRSEPMKFPIKKDSFWWVIMMGIEHERIHLETSSVIHRQADLSVVQPSAAFPRCDRGRFHTSSNSAAARSAPSNRIIQVAAGTTRLGRSWDGTKTYGWDNEFGTVTQAMVPAFGASEFIVSNVEFLDFIEAGGYSTERFWSSEGWSWVTDMKPKAPVFWRRRGDEYYLRTLCEEVPMPWDWPAEVCHHEAAAFCKYLSEKTGKTLRLPMEDEYLRMRDAIPTDLQDSAHGPAWGDETPGNVNLAHWASSCPVDMFKSPIGLYDVLGNVWQHSATHIDVLDGFQTHPLYDDFTTPTVGGMHSRIMGGSWISTGANGGTRDSRYGFRRHFMQHAGFRYVETDREVVNRASPFEEDRQLCSGFRFHFDEPVSGINFHSGLAQACVDALHKIEKTLDTARVLELGCGPGRTVLELAKHGVSAAHGADRSAKAFQCTAQRLLVEGGRLRWLNYEEGDHATKRELGLAEVGFPASTDATNVQFFQIPDYAAVDTQKFNDYDLVVCAQPGELGRSDPLGLLSAVHGLLKPGGILVVGTQYEWPAPSLGGVAASGEDVLAASLQPWFKPMADSTDLPYTLTETARKLECGTQHLTFWERRASKHPNLEASIAWASRSSGQLDTTSQGQAIYDEAATVGQYLDFHFGPKARYPVACAEHCVRVASALGVPMKRALEVGGGPGRASMELSKSFGHVDGGDYSQHFVELGQKLLRDGELQWRIIADRTAGVTAKRRISASDLGIGSVSFRQMDAHALPHELQGYDLICGFNLIDRLAHPTHFLSDVKTRLNIGGLLVISSPYTWLEEFTAKDRWLGGYKYGDNDGPTTYGGLKEFLLSQGFAEAHEPQEVSFRIEELGNGRKNQQTRAQMTFWQLKSR